MNELRAQIVRDVLYLSIAVTFGWYIWLGVRFPAQAAPDQGLIIVPIVALAWGCAHLIRQGVQRRAETDGAAARAIRLARILYLGGSALLLSLAIWLYDAPNATWLYSILALAAVVVSGPKAGMAMALLGGLATAFLSRVGSLRFSASMPTGLVLLQSSLSVALGWMLSRRLELAVTWSWNSYEEARQNLTEARQRRAQVLQLNQELRRAQERLERANASLVRAWRAAEEAERRQKQITAFISHELRTPLNLVIGFSEMLVTSPETYALPDLPPRARRDLYAIYRSAQQVAGLLDDVLDMASVDAGQLALMREPADLWQVIEEAAALVHDYVESKNLALRLERGKNLVPVLIDRLRIRQVVLNLLVNAIRFTEQGSITVQAFGEAGRLRVLVRDTGAGIPPERMERIFQAFQTAESPDLLWKQGTGLGLPLSRRLVEMHGGQMGVTSTVGQGSTFWFTLPIAIDQEQEGVPQRVTSVPPLPPVSKPAIVVVDEDGIGTRRLQRWLEDYHLNHAPNAIEALRLADELQAPAVIIPQEEPLPVLKGRPAVIRCPLDSTAHWARQLGAAAYLSKPVTAAQMIAKLKRVAPSARRLLVVDDDPHFVQLMLRFLESANHGYLVRTAYTGEEALQNMREDCPDALLLDLALPGIDGRQVLREMAADLRLAHVPVIVVSAPPPENDMAPLGHEFTVYRSEGLALGQVTRLLHGVLAALSPPNGLPQREHPPTGVTSPTTAPG
ncbi:MAG: response regulator [Chloroflexi bacterium]|nr:response regulator [Chloroflexota bacterium]